jgi:hypothetical protein
LEISSLLFCAFFYQVFRVILFLLFSHFVFLFVFINRTLATEQSFRAEAASTWPSTTSGKASEPLRTRSTEERHPRSHPAPRSISNRRRSLAVRSITATESTKTARQSTVIRWSAGNTLPEVRTAIRERRPRSLRLEELLCRLPLRLAARHHLQL